ncbi:uncharacterized protein TRAVEDRAFT_32179 [Trametes versicolor FP-101664 SS1]|uniref:Uncharacterized protein n=1 Tax=Trametes versicolor (strain FP-101664) TaxID=717944 RepID=R7S8K4_TRAVS|nr:uncharacterized protein TRAVEDRAFT_32179 [Trametes versicolor FP-101664 SS1]EIW51987.1 hypothetical protein TRAVEDRAFT_32179 [Trametes versicolor FP-101664 SS1]
MPSRTKKQAKQIVVRTVEPGTRRSTKAVFGTLTELNNHKPLVSPPLTPHVGYRPLPPTTPPPSLPPLRIRSTSGAELMSLPCKPRPSSTR